MSTPSKTKASVDLAGPSQASLPWNGLTGDSLASYSSYLSNSWSVAIFRVEAVMVDWQGLAWRGPLTTIWSYWKITATLQAKLNKQVNA